MRVHSLRVQKSCMRCSDLHARPVFSSSPAHAARRLVSNSTPTDAGPVLRALPDRARMDAGQLAAWDALHARARGADCAYVVRYGAPQAELVLVPAFVRAGSRAGG